MPLINTSLPNLIQGVSQQPDATRFAGQCETQENALSSVAEGLKKRPNTRHVAKLLSTAIDNNSFVHFINRDDEEKYVVIHTGSTLEAWNTVTGVKCSITDADAVAPEDSSYSTNNYLTTTNPREDIKALTVADNTFIVNKNVSVGISQTKTPSLDRKGFVYIAQGDYKKNYQVTIGGNVAGDVSANQAIFNVVVESYYHGSGWHRFRIGSVTVVSEGSDYAATTPTLLNVSIDFGLLGTTSPRSYKNLTTNPVINAVFVDDGTGNGTKKIESVVIVDKGKFASHDQSETGASFSADYNGLVVLTAQGDTATGINHTFSTVGTSSNANDAATDNIATSLFNGTYAPSTFAGAIPMIGSDATNPIFTDADPALTPTREGNTIIIQHNRTSGDFTLETTDGLGGEGIKAVYKRVNSLVDLPVKAPNNFVIEIVGDADLDQDNYWVKFATNSGSDFGEGAWEETYAPDISDGFDAADMPMSIRSVDLNRLEVSTLDFKKRRAGDTTSNPDPSFVGKTIEDVIFFQNRLGFITEDSVVFSEAGEFFNFYKTTVSTLLDTAPIDVTVSTTKVTKLSSGLVFQENLMLFADNVQFVMKGGETFTPRTVSVSASTNFSLEEETKPILLGSYVYFPFTRGAFTGMRELAVKNNTETYDAVEITEHVPAYIPNNIIAMKGTTSENILALLSANDRSSLYIYNYFWSNDQKVISAWSKFTFTGSVHGMEFIDSVLYLVISNNGETNLVKMPIESGLEDTNAPFIAASVSPTSLGYVTHLDTRLETTISAVKTPFADATTTGWSQLFNSLPPTPDGSAFSARVTGEVAFKSITMTKGKITGSFNVVALRESLTGNRLLIKDSSNNILFEHAITLGINTFYYQPISPTEAAPASLSFSRSVDANAHTAHIIEVKDINIADGDFVDRITLPYAPVDNSVEVYTTDGHLLQATNVGNIVTLSQAVTTDTNVFVGIPYNMKYTFSEQLFKATAGQGKSPNASAKFMIRNGAIYYDKTSYFKVTVTPKARDSYVNTFTTAVVGSSELGELELESGFFRFPVFTKAEDTVITVENDSALPSNLQSAEFESFLHSRSNRYG